jgi:N-formylglutamate amidohydrolase
MPRHDFWSVTGREGPIVATAIHDGHAVRENAAAWLAVDENVRLREEDPFTACWTRVGDVRVVAGHSRFEFDLNRPREQAVYRRPQDAWGLTVWQRDVPARVFVGSLALYDAFYQELRGLLDRLTRHFGRVVVLDIHSYNHRRAGPDAPADPCGHPDVNIGTSNMDRARWAPVVDRFVADMSAGTVQGRRLDVRENVCFQGGHLARWVHEHFSDSACAIAVEFKKIFMDEWTGAGEPAVIADIGRVLEATVPGLRRELDLA